ncbi:hypothetical protein ACWDRR_33355 [Kitasatospora sp. NPDC003701]
MLEKDRLDNVINAYVGGSQPSYYGPGWQYTAPFTGPAIGDLFGGVAWGEIFAGIGLIAEPFARNSCDTPTGHRNTTNTSSNTSTPPRPKPVDPHKVAPTPCTTCFTPTPEGNVLNGPQLGPTQQGIAAQLDLDPATLQQMAATEAAILQGSTQTFDFSGNSNKEAEGCPAAGVVDYWERDAANGKRATGVEACLTVASIKNGSAAQQRGVPGYRWAQKLATGDLGAGDAKYSVNACHLLGDQLGGTGRLADLATCGRSTNAARQDIYDPGRDGPMTAFENLVRQEVEAGQQVLYRV